MQNLLIRVEIVSSNVRPAVNEDNFHNALPRDPYLSAVMDFDFRYRDCSSNGSVEFATASRIATRHGAWKEERTGTDTLELPNAPLSATFQCRHTLASDICNPQGDPEFEGQSHRATSGRCEFGRSHDCTADRTSHIILVSIIDSIKPR